MSLSNRKMSLSRDMNKVSREYNEALNQTVLKWSNDSGATYNALTYDLMMKPNDLNSTVPYIVTDANTGKVVLNDDELTDADGNGLGISYIDIAKMISSYSGVTTAADGTVSVNYDNDATYTQNNAYGVSTTYGYEAIDGAYYVPNTSDFSFQNCLRYEIFALLGLIDEEDVTEQNNLLIQLYGSAEAEETGVYPVGSAWGDYYIALANLEAYEDFIANEQNLSTAGTYSGTAQTSATFHDSSSLYSYTANVNGVSGTSTITQSDYSNGAASHIDFSNVVVSDTNGDYSVASSSSVGSTYYDDYANSYTGTDGIVYSTSVSSGGITHTYEIDDLLTNAFENYETNNGTTLDSALTSDVRVNSGTDAILSELKTSMTSGSNSSTGAGLVCLRSKVNDYDWDDKDRTACKDGLSTILTAYMALMGNCSITEIGESAMTKAANQTINLYMSNINAEKISATSSEGAVNTKAKQNATGRNGFGIARKKFCAWPWSVSRAKTAIYVDTKPLFETFMSYYNYFLENPTEGDVTSLVSGGTYDDDETSSDSYTVKYSTVSSGSDSYLLSSYTDSDGYTYATRSAISTTNDFTDSEYLYISSGGTSVTNTATIGYTGYYVDNDGEALQYKTNKTSFSVTTADGETLTVYGVVNSSSDTYYLTTSEMLNSYLAGASASSLCNAYTGSGETLTDSYDQIYADTANSYYIDIEKASSASKYAISTDDYVEEDGTYHAMLQSAVNDALEYINELEEELKNLYGSADTKLMDYYDALFQKIAECGWVEDESTSAEHNSNATEYLNNKLQNNDYFVTVCTEKADETGYNYTTKMATSVLKIFEVNDTNAQNQALTKYESEKTLISNKEEVIDTLMQQLETEQEAINTELESLENVKSENIDRTFKMFA